MLVKFYSSMLVMIMSTQAEPYIHILYIRWLWGQIIKILQHPFSLTSGYWGKNTGIHDNRA